MSRECNLFRRNGVYYLRVQTPKALQALRTRAGEQSGREVWRSLRTSDFAEARRRVCVAKAQILKGFEEEISRRTEELAVEPSVTLVRPSLFDLQVAAFQFRPDEERRQRTRLLTRLSPADLNPLRESAAHAARNAGGHLAALASPEAFALRAAAPDREADAESRALLLEELEAHYRTNEFALVADLVDGLRVSRGWDIPPGGQEERHVSQWFLLAWIHALKNVEREESGDHIPAMADVALMPGSSPESSAEPNAPSRCLTELVEDYIDECHATAVSQTKKSIRAAVRRFEECAGKKAVTDYTVDDVARFKRHLRSWPKNAERLFPGRSFADVLVANRQRSQAVEPIRAATVNEYLSRLSAFGKWLESNVKGVRSDAFRTTAVQVPRTEKRRYTEFSDEQVVSILNAPAFVGCRSERDQKSPGNHRIRDYRFWIPAICAFTGARLGEVSQIKLSDFRLDGGRRLLLINDGEAQSLKNKHSRRTIPIAASLIKMGLLEHVEKCRAAGREWLFEEIVPDRDGRRGTRAGKAFRKLLDRLGIAAEGGNGASHRFRHTFITKLRAAGLANHEIAPIVGHGAGEARMTAHYGSGSALTVERMEQAINGVRYQGLRIDVLRNRSSGV